MEDFTALAASLVASVGDVRGCAILSRDGLVLGVHPEDGEAATRSAWLRFAAMGEPERGFVQFGTEIWCYARRGGYAAFVLSGIEVRPGVVIDRIEQILLAAEEFRTRRERPRPPQVSVTPVAGSEVAPAPAAESETVDSAETQDAPEPGIGRSPDPPMEVPGEVPGTPEQTDSVWAAPAAEPAVGEDEEIDRVLLAREFAQLLQEDSDAADG